MTAQYLRDVLAQPPPLEMDLIDSDRGVGWIVGDTIGFRGFKDESEATHASWIAHRALARRLARTHGMRLVPIDIEPLALRRSESGEKDVILASDRPIATLVRPGNHSRSGDSFGFELVVPRPMAEFELRGLAYLIYRTLRRSGVRWALWRPEPVRRAEPVRETDAMRTARVPERVERRHRFGWALAGQVFRRLRQQLRLTTDAVRGFTRGWNPTVYK